MKANERAWRFVDHYSNPGPIQYNDKGATSITDTVDQVFSSETEVSEQIRGLCNQIYNDTMFTEHPHLLVAALNALKAAKGVITSMNQKEFHKVSASSETPARIRENYSNH